MASNLLFFGFFVVFAALITLWRRAEAWADIALRRRVILAVGASRPWWLVYSVGCFTWLMLRQGKTFRDSISVVRAAVVLAGLCSRVRSPSGRNPNRSPGPNALRRHFRCQQPRVPAPVVASP